jgi:hypothetical protein
MKGNDMFRSNKKQTQFNTPLLKPSVVQKEDNTTYLVNIGFKSGNVLAIPYDVHSLALNVYNSIRENIKTGIREDEYEDMYGLPFTIVIGDISYLYMDEINES